MKNQDDYWLLDRATNIDAGSDYSEFASTQWAFRIQIFEAIEVEAIYFLAKSIDSANLGTVLAQLFSVENATAVPADNATVCGRPASPSWPRSLRCAETGST
jgi:hypothetical protein